ncbi:phosphoheptose isomerase [Bacillus phage vB_BanS-Tsamsa]|uniref:Uncharacterized protein n=1 Tax=Bacillus phage vB_BanS-Tsamsa TaxID=1308863 RepID=U5J9Q6_9CAUD|nr:phosphoheptose isomerase [Bacillus phage vB_BanS-Tsamsa]AGI11846.1 hypothetical protein [Bacillus phage vB_BanS-Tsamsa]
MTLKYKHVAIDFDGTIVNDGCYPAGGKFKENAVHVMKRIIAEGGFISIWTCRNGKEQEEVITEKLTNAGIYDFKLNAPFDYFTNIYGGDNARKIFADTYIDDRSIHAQQTGIDWYEIEKMLFESVDKDKK